MSTNRVAIGALGGGAFGLKVSKPGYEVTDPTTTEERLSFSSDWGGALKLGAYGTTTLPSSATGNYPFTVMFGQTFSSIPILFLKNKVSGRYWPTDAFLPGSVGTTTSSPTPSSVASMIEVKTDRFIIASAFTFVTLSVPLNWFAFLL